MGVSDRAALPHLVPVSNRSQPAVFAVPIASLGLSVRAKDALLSIGVISVSDLIDRVRIVGLEPNKLNCCNEINGAFRALLRAVSEVDWPGYLAFHNAATRFQSLPGRKLAVWLPNDFVTEFPDVVRDAVRLQFGPRHSIIVERRILSPPGQRWTLERGGRELGVTRKRIHTIEKRIVLTLRLSLLHDDYRRLRFRIDSRFAEPIKKLHRAISTQQKRTIASEAWVKLLKRVWGVDLKAVASVESLILDILDLRIRD